MDLEKRDPLDDPQLHLKLGGDVRAPGLARRQVGDWLMMHDLDGDATEALLVIVSELVTNAVIHARSAPEVTVTLQDGCVRIEVLDTATAPPVTRRFEDAGRAGGFGLRLVQALAHRWGWEPTGSGKLVWAEMLRSA